MPSRSQPLACTATALALSLINALGGPRGSSLRELEPPPQVQLPFRADSLPGARGPLVLPPRLAALTGLAETLAPAADAVDRTAAHTPAREPEEEQEVPEQREVPRQEPSVTADELAIERLPEDDTWRPALELSGFLRTSLESNWENRWPDADRLTRGASLDNARLMVDGRAGPLSVYLSLEGSTDGGSQYLMHDGEADEVEVLDAWADLRVLDGLTLRAGRFRAPVTFAAQLDENELLFQDRTGLSQRWIERDAGVALHGRGGRLEAWLAVQNGTDGTADELAFTARGVLRLFGEGEAPRREGAYDADLGETVYLGLAWHEDRSIPDSRVLLADAYCTFEALAVSGEFQSPSDGFQVGADFWNVTASAMLVPETWELAARYEDFRDRAGARVWRMGLVRYLHGAETKLQLGVARLEHPDSHLNLTSLDLTLVASF